MIYLFTYLKITVLSTKYMVINNKQMSRCIISLNISDLLTNFNTSYISWFTTLSLKTDLKSIVYSCIWLTVWTRIKWSTVKSKLDFPRCGTSSTYILQKRKKEKISSYSTITYRIFFLYRGWSTSIDLNDQDPTSKQTFISYYVAFILVHQNISIPYKWDKYPIRDIPTE